MAEAFVRTLKRDYARVSPRPDAYVIEQLPKWLEHTIACIHTARSATDHPASLFNRSTKEICPAFRGHNN